MRGDPVIIDRILVVRSRKGSLTGATQRRLGRFELAEGGTLFLDEIGEPPLEAQIVLLRVFCKSGNSNGSVGLSLFALTPSDRRDNRDLQGAITAGTFRSDLFYRLNVFPIALPPSRERKQDIPPLFSCFVDRYGEESRAENPGIRKSALDLLETYSWPGNIRELQNIVERSHIVCKADEFTIAKSWLSGEPMPIRSADQASIETSAPGARELIEAAWLKPRARCLDYRVPQPSSVFRPLLWNRKFDP